MLCGGREDGGREEEYMCLTLPNYMILKDL